MITVIYNGDKNVPPYRNHKVLNGTHKLEKKFKKTDDAIYFWLECEFYSGAISPLEDILPKNYNSHIVSIMHEKPIAMEEVLLSTKDLYNYSEAEEMEEL